MTETPRDPPAPQGPVAPGDPVQLLIRALGTLPEADRNAVYAWLLRREPGVLPGSAWPRPMSRAFGDLTTALLQPGGPGVAQFVRTAFASGQQMVPVRFSTEQHA